MTVPTQQVKRGRRAGLLLLVYAAALALTVLSPVAPMALVRIAARWMRDLGAWFVRDGWVEFAANIVMFVPLSLLLALWLWRTPARGLLLACAASVAIELAQMLLPSRVASLRDVIANVLGAVVGYLIAKILLRRDTR